MESISIIVPTLNEALSIQFCLASLQPLRERGHEVIVVDGGSVDDTLVLAEVMADRVCRIEKGRARQLNYGAAEASGNLLLFLHADTLLSREAEAELDELAARESVWGRFDICLTGRNPLFRVIESTMNLRSRLSGIATGDQAIFVSRTLFEGVGGFPDIELMEDIRLSAQLKRRQAPHCSRATVLSSSRRWERGGIVRTVLSMHMLRLRFALGADPAALAREYDA